MIGVFALAAKKSVKSAVLTVQLTSGESACFQTHEWLALDLKAKLTPGPEPAPPASSRNPFGDPVPSDLRRG